MDVVKGEGIVPVLFVVVDFESAVWWQPVRISRLHSYRADREGQRYQVGWIGLRSFPITSDSGCSLHMVSTHGAKNTRQIRILAKVNSPNTGAGTKIEHSLGILDRCKV